MITLAIDSSTYRGTVAVVRDQTVVASEEAAMRGQHSEELLPAVSRTLVAANIAIRDVGRVVCGEGPGSFTSLRIGAAIAKGIAVGGGVPLYAVSSLGLALAASPLPAGRYVVTLDALRDEWYAAVFGRLVDGTVVEETAATRVATADLPRFASAHDAAVMGAAADGAHPHAAACVSLFATLERRGAVDVERWEPNYGRLAEAQVKWEASHGRALHA